MSIFLPGLRDLPTGLYYLSVDNSQKDKTVYTIGRHLRHSPPDFEMIRGLDIFYSEQPVSIPQGHGRLIDADALKEKWTHRDLDLFAQGWWCLKDLNRAPTIIPAEPEEGPEEEESDV